VLILLALTGASGNRAGALRAAEGAASEFPFVNHEVQRGETLFGIAERYYGSGYLWPQLKEYNSWVDPDRLIVGSTIFVPNPTRSYRPSRITARHEGRAHTSRNLPGGVGGGAGSMTSLLGQIRSATFFGFPMSRVLLGAAFFFVFHALFQGLFVWFAAQMSFVKNVSFAKSMRATVQAEGLASVLLVCLVLLGLVMVYVGTSPPGRPALDELLGSAETFLGSSTGVVVVAVAIVGLYVFLGLRFIPQAFEIPGSQGIAVVFLAVLVPHIAFLYVLAQRVGLIGGVGGGA
jgi:hypothetical protein